MNDLLNEEEFLPKEYNPKGWFVKFHIVACLLSLIGFGMVRYYRSLFTNTTATITIIFTFLVPLILSLIMILPKREILLQLKPRTVAYKILLLNIFCCTVILALGLIKPLIHSELNLETLKYTALVILLMLAIYAIVYGISMAIIIPILKRAQRINKLPQ
ncbi:hypothetical protein ACLI1A_05160 [Flavobacterium sp. RHBU_3]|uniref:hypothetical protein n=1 Tax=Flavobacterium sp. RHBU_3 TaxID=3391184 RepID=UPI0039855116